MDKLIRVLSVAWLVLFLFTSPSLAENKENKSSSKFWIIADFWLDKLFPSSSDDLVFAQSTLMINSGGQVDIKDGATITIGQ